MGGDDEARAFSEEMPTSASTGARGGERARDDGDARRPPPAPRPAGTSRLRAEIAEAHAATTTTTKEEEEEGEEEEACVSPARAAALARDTAAASASASATATRRAGARVPRGRQRSFDDRDGDGSSPRSRSRAELLAPDGSGDDDGGGGGGGGGGAQLSKSAPSRGSGGFLDAEEDDAGGGSRGGGGSRSDSPSAAEAAHSRRFRDANATSPTNPGGGITRNTSSFVLAADQNPTPQSIPPPSFGDQGNIGEKHVLVMVGLPARGKTHMAKRLCQYLRFFHGARTQVFNVGSYRRKMMPAGRKADAKFFDQSDAESEKTRKEFARAALKDMIDFLFQSDVASCLEQRGFDSGRVAIFDATNTTRARREWIRKELHGLPLKLLFIESVCTDEQVIDRNIWHVKVQNEDYSDDADKRRAFDDFKLRIAHYEKVYEPMDEEHLSYIKLINQGRRVEINNIHGFLLGRIVQFLSNLHATHQTIYLCRHGQSEYNFLGKIGGDSGLSPMGEAFATKLGEYCEREIATDPETREPRPCRLWTSSLRRTILTGRHIPHPKIRTKDGENWIQMAPRVLRNLDEIYAGVCDGMTYEEIEVNYPEEFALRRENKLSYRYPRGESYLDVISRLDPLVQELESYQEPVLIIGHQGVLRLIYAYFTGMDRADACTASIPLNAVITLTPKTHTCEELRTVLHTPTAEEMGVVTGAGGNEDDAGGGVSPTGADAIARSVNPFATNMEPPSY